MKPIKTNWFVVTGGPCSGKTTLLDFLKIQGYSTHPETARTFIDESIAKGKTLEQIRSDESVFQRKVFEMKIEIEESLIPSQMNLLDRGIPDSIAYYEIYNEDPTEVIKAAGKRRYKGVFLLEQVPFEKDNARIEDQKEALVINTLINKAYVDLGYKVIKIPFLPVRERAAQIIKHLK